MEDILTEIVAHKRKEVAMYKLAVPTEGLRELVDTLPPSPRSMKASFDQPKKMLGSKS